MKKLFSFSAYYPRKDTLQPRRRTFLSVCLICGALLFSIPLSSALGLLATPAYSHEADPHPHAEDSEVGATKDKHPEHGTLGNVGAKLANPLADVGRKLANLWSLQMNFEVPKFYDGDVNTGDPKVGVDIPQLE